MAVEVRRVSEEELWERIEKLESALKELDRWEAKYESRRQCQQELDTARWLLTGGREGRIDGS